MWEIVDNGTVRESTDLESFALAFVYLGAAIEAAQDPHTARLLADGAYERFLNSDEDGQCTLEAVAGVLGVCKERVKQIQDSGLAKMKVAMDELGGKKAEPPRRQVRLNWHTRYRSNSRLRRKAELLSLIAQIGPCTMNDLYARMGGLSKQCIRNYLIEFERDGKLTELGRAGKTKGWKATLWSCAA